MSGLSGNPHYQSTNVRNVHTNDGLIEATLALAFEQRTANLIALWQQPTTETSTATLGLLDSRLMDMQQEILERLGAKP